MIAALFYFGFVRDGCICPIGAIQNVTLTVFDSSYAIPLVAAAFFVVPLVFTLFCGRVFCGAVCPLGAIQDAVLIHPVRVPRWLESGLRLLAYTYLGAAVLFAAIGSAFLICRYDPFVGFFRLSGNWNILILGVSLLVIGLFVGRPYCRFLCPYGVILRQLSRLSKKRVTITPSECIKCRLCEDACPFGAIREPTERLARRRVQDRQETTGLVPGAAAGSRGGRRLGRLCPEGATGPRASEGADRRARLPGGDGPSRRARPMPATRSERPGRPPNRSTSRCDGDPQSVWRRRGLARGFVGLVAAAS